MNIFSAPRRFMWFMPFAGVLLTGLFAGALSLDAASPEAPERGGTVKYTVLDLGVLPWVSDDVAPRMNASGEISCWQQTADKTVHAFVWNGGVLQDIGMPPGYVSSIATGVNSKGEVAGWSVKGRNLVDSRATTHAFLYSRGRMSDLGTLGGRDSKATSINESGDVAGWSSIPDSSHHAFRYRGGKLEDLGTLPGGTFSAAYAINNRGLIAGAAEAPKQLVHAVIWRGGAITDLGTLPGGMRSRALALNEREEIVGFSEAEGAETHAFLYANGRMQDLGSLGNDPVRANAINNRGQIVGASGINSFARHAFLWESGKMQDLNKLIPPGDGWRIEEAMDIDDAGQILCAGTQAGASAVRHLLLLKPTGGELTSERLRRRRYPLRWNAGNSPSLAGRTAGSNR